MIEKGAALRVEFDSPGLLSAFLAALFTFSAFLGAVMLFAAWKGNNPPAMGWLGGAFLAAAVVAQVIAAGFRRRHVFDFQRRVLLCEQRRFFAWTARVVAPFSGLAAVGVTGIKMASRGAAWAEHAPVVITRGGMVIRLGRTEARDEGYNVACATASSLAERLSVPMHPPERARTLVAGGDGRPVYVDIRQDVPGFLMAGIALGIVGGVIVYVDKVWGLAAR